MPPDNNHNKLVYVIAGPTGVGKTAVAIALARQLGTEILSADSRQCYRGMAIGAAQPTEAELRAVKHHFIAELPVTEAVTAAGYEKLALQYLDHIFKTHDTAVVCGGTGLYIKALCEGLDDMPETDPARETEVMQLYEEGGLARLQEALRNEDPLFLDQGEAENPARLIRALAFKRSAGRSILDYRTGSRKPRPFRMIKIGLELPREQLYSRINARVDQMMEQGLLEEVKQLYPLRKLKNLHTVGYTELFEYLDGKCSLDEAVEKIKQHSRNYAKRQLTWFRKDPEMHWLQVSEQTADDILAIR